MIEIKCTLNVTRLNHPEIIPHRPGPWKNFSSVKMVPGAKKVGTAALRHMSFNELLLFLDVGPSPNKRSLLKPLHQFHDNKNEIKCLLVE